MNSLYIGRRIAVVNFIPLATCTLASMFMTFLLYRYSTSQKKHHILWAMAMGIVFFTSLLEFFAEIDGWSADSYKIFYVLMGLMVPLMGLGALHLLENKKWSRYFLYYFVVVGAIFVILAFIASVDEGRFANVAVVGSGVMPSYVLLSLLLLFSGSLALVVGGLYNFRQDMTTKAGLLIAIGGLLYPAAVVLAFAGMPVAFYPLQLVSVIVLFTGFFKAEDHGKEVDKEPEEPDEMSI